MEFKKVAQTFEEISAVSSRLEITRLLAGALKEAKPHEAEIICNLSLGLLRPPYLGNQFNFAEKNLIKVIAQLLDQDEEKVTAQAKKLGDLGLVVEQGIWRPKATLSVDDVYDELAKLEEISGTGSQEEKSLRALQLLKTIDPLSAKYVVRIILGQLRLGFSDMTILDALSWMSVGNKSLHGELEDAYNICADIGLIASIFKKEGIDAIKHMQIHIGIPIRPAAAERLPTAHTVFEKLGRCIAQPKLDGFRLQIHMRKQKGKEPEVHFFSRNLIDMSQMFPDVLEAILKLDVESIIAEGEAISFDEASGHFLPFQETVKRKRKHGIEEAVTEYPLRVYLFDLLYLDGKSLMDDTHEQRRDELLKIFKKFKDSTIQVIDEKQINSVKDLEDYFYQNITAGLEGLVVKKPDSTYQPGKRNFNWIKLKRQETGHLEDTIDAVVLGYYLGSGKRVHFGIGGFLVGVYNKAKDCFQSVAKVGTGLTDEEWKELRLRCDEFKAKAAPKNVEVAKELTPDVWVNPEIVCIVRADELTRSPVHTAGKTIDELGYALRFPRFMGYSLDKSPEEATTVHEIKRMYEDQFKS